MTTRHEIPEGTALRAYLDGCSPEYHEDDIADVIRRSIHGDAVAAQMVKDALAYLESHNQRLARETAAKRAALTRLMRELQPLSPSNAGVAWYCREAAKALNNPYSDEVDEDVSAEAVAVLETGVLGDGPYSAATLRGWYEGLTVTQILA